MKRIPLYKTSPQPKEAATSRSSSYEPTTYAAVAPNRFLGEVLQVAHPLFVRAACYIPLLSWKRCLV
jgi:hypothetical protein